VTLALTLHGAHPILILMGEYKSSNLDAVFSALGDPTRRAILARLQESDARVTDIAGDFPISLNSVSKHIRTLERAKLLRRTVSGRDHLLSLNAAPLAEATAWMEHYRRFWDGRLAALETYVLAKKRKRR
jgi:DNA-binding transcriptional ArsR family regulator